jgi:LacI family fructose operon transcriptional repressor
MQLVLADQGLPDALITASYTLLQGVLDVLLEQPGGLPQSLRMATFGDDRLLDFLPVKVHSLPQKHEAIAEATLDRALAAIAGHGEPETVIINRSLKRRR